MQETDFKRIIKKKCQSRIPIIIQFIYEFDKSIRISTRRKKNSEKLTDNWTATDEEEVPSILDSDGVEWARTGPKDRVFRVKNMKGFVGLVIGEEQDNGLAEVETKALVLAACGGFSL